MTEWHAHGTATADRHTHAQGRVTVLAFGKGNAADAQHPVAVFVGRRRRLPAIALTLDSGVFTSLANDYGYELRR